MKARIPHTGLLAALLGVLCACVNGGEGTHVGNPGATGTLAFKAVGETQGLPVFSDDAGTPYTLTDARANLRHIELDLPAGISCEDVEAQLRGASCETGDDKVVIDGPIVVDLVSGTSTPALSDVRLPSLLWQRVDFRLDDAEPEDGLVTAGSDLDDHSFVAYADFIDSSQRPAELAIQLKFNEDARAEAPGGVALPEGGTLLVLLNVEGWLDGAPIERCLDDGDLSVEDGLLLIDEHSDCSDIEGTLKDNIKTSGALSASP